ncbi:NAD+ synthase [Kordiimonas sp. SCSIO 12610]|uniref:NAD+ synthase n=1 Tax=Kordiimonas sp. SCSIO 12610 TaxID=2829597 RepID=UPI0021090248|nr:NAD+ synthase [Kordiimonas sp. SCSIO 12610]UTW54137.1 NAD+ synthase [Kordiimonas sp. SCSIO 12610]
MTYALKIYLAQINATVGAVDSNCDRISEIYNDAIRLSADLVLTPELSVVGYPPEDLVLKPFFIRKVESAIERLKTITKGEGKPGLIVGVPKYDGDILRNASLLIENGEVQAVRYKHKLPNYGVFDEKRVFTEAEAPLPMDFRGLKLGVMVCEDMWFDSAAKSLADNGADILLVPTCSPYHEHKYDERLAVARERVSETKLPLVFCNQIGGQDELVFDGASFVLEADGSQSVQMDSWAEGFCLTEWRKEDDKLTCVTKSDGYVPERMEDIYQAMVLALTDYVHKNRFPGVLIGLSGGIDSALSAAVAVDALGPDKVHCVMMPTKYTSGESISDAEACAKALGVQYDTIAIKPGVDAFDDMLGPVFEGLDADTTEENIQSRLRGLVLMSLSNKFGKMVLTTGNKSEMSVGYATLYGDMCGGYSVLKDVYKMDVFALSHWRNTSVPKGGLGPAGIVIPENIITKPPSAELRDDQKDEDSLPPYEALDDMLRCLVDEEMPVSEIVERGHDASEVARIEHLLYIAEYKRRQSPPGVKITRKNFGRDRRYPITNGFRSAER